MKFYCDSCQAKYSIPDQKVRGKVLKVRCKKCSHVITVREPKSPGAGQSTGGGPAGSSREASGGAPPPAPSQQSLKWYYSVNGQSYGPLDEEELAEKFAGGELGDATYVWNETFHDWKPAKTVSVFADALGDGRQVRPSRNTMGAGETLDAVERTDQIASDEAAGATEEPGPEADSEPEADDEADGEDWVSLSPSADEADEPPESEGVDEDDSGVGPVAETGEFRGDGDDSPAPESSEPRESTPEDESGSGRLDKLRDRLKLDSDSEEPAAEPEDEAPAGELEASDRRDGDVDVDESDEESETGGVDRLREKLGGTDGTTEAAGEASPRETDREPGVGETTQEADSRPDVDESRPPEVDSREPEQPAEKSDPVQDDGADSGFVSSEEASHDGLFADFDGEEAAGPGPRTPETDDRKPEDDVGVGPEKEAPEDEQAEDAVPFFPSAPELGDDEEEDATSTSRVGEMTDSLLIQINEIKSDGRKRKVMGTVGVVAALAVVAGVVFLAWDEMGVEEGMETDDQVREAGVGQRPEFGEYSEEELAQVSDRMVLEEEMEVGGGDEVPDEESGTDPQPSQPSGGGAAEPRDEETDDDPGLGDVDPDAFRSDGSEVDGAGPDEGVEAGASGGRFAGAGDGGGTGPGGGDEMPSLDDIDTDDLDEEQAERLERMAAVQGDDDREIFQGDGDIDLEATQMQEGLTSAQMADGVERIGQSVGDCRQRHVMRGGDSLEADQLTVTIRVMPDGNVGQFSVEPDSLDDTDFKRCMDSHTNRWRFPRFKGDPVEIEAPFALQ